MTEKQMRLKVGVRRVSGYAAAALMVAGGWTAGAQTQARSQYTGPQFPTGPQLQLPDLPTPKPVTPNGAVVEDVIARVGDGIITRSEYERSEQELLASAQQSKATQAELDDRQKDLLRDMIDQQLLLQKAKELNISGDSETLRQLDEIRKQNHMGSMDELAAAAQSQGVSFEDFKKHIHDQIVTSEVVRDEVGRHINMTHTMEEQYYNAHKDEFTQPEQVHLSEILIPTPDNATDAQIAEAQKKADDAAAKLKAGANFADLARTVSGGPTAQGGGDLGDFKRGVLGGLEDPVFALQAGGVTAPIRTKQGFVILRVDSHTQPGVPPMKDVEPQVQEAIYNQQMQPALRAYLTKARGDAYIDIEKGFVDSGANAKETKATFSAYVAPAPKKKTVEKQRLESEKAVQAQQALTAAREKEREKQEEKIAEQQKKAGVTNVAAVEKAPKVQKEKIRYGQAPRNSLPTGRGLAPTEEGTPLTGQSPASALGTNDASTTVGGDTEDVLAPKAESDHKGRFSDREREYEVEHAKTKVTHTTAKATARPLQATTTEKTDEAQQHQAIGLNGDTTPKKPTLAPGEAKPRLQQQKPEDKSAPAGPEPAPTVNPTLTQGAGQSAAAKDTTEKPKASDQPMLPPAYQGAPGAPPQGQPIPATTSTEAGAPTATPAPH